MKFKDYTYLWLILTVLLGAEWIVLTFVPHYSVFALLQRRHLFPVLSLSPKAGAPLSYFFGWVGFGFIVLTNAYVLKRRFGIGKGWGTMKGWLDFHIFCGMIGPTFILFHANFHSRGLVSLTYWSMIIVAVSGLVGRYFYIKVVSEEKDSDKRVQHYQNKISNWAKQASPSDLQRIEAAKSQALVFMGVPAKFLSSTPSVGEALYYSVWGDLRSLIMNPQFKFKTQGSLRQDLLKWAYFLRKKYYLKPFQTLLGYWHAFHLPFALLMYVTVIFHIIAATLFRGSVSH